MRFATSPKRIESILFGARSEEHTSELQSQSNLVCRLLLEKKKKQCMYFRYSRAPRRHRPYLTTVLQTSYARKVHHHVLGTHVCMPDAQSAVHQTYRVDTA